MYFEDSVSFSITYELFWKRFIYGLSVAPQLSRFVQTCAGFLCDKATLLGETINERSVIIENSSCLFKNILL
jgi:hypothetical protein